MLSSNTVPKHVLKLSRRALELAGVPYRVLPFNDLYFELLVLDHTFHGQNVRYHKNLK